MFTIIAAKDLNDFIGKDGDLPWKIKSELKHFKKITKNSIVVMGRKTWQSLPNNLPGREIWVISSNNIENNNITTIKSFGELIEKSKKEKRHIFICGGESIYKWAIDDPNTTKMIVTKIYIETEGNAIFPKIDEKKWILKKIVTHHLLDEPKYEIHTYVRN